MEPKENRRSDRLTRTRKEPHAATAPGALPTGAPLPTAEGSPEQIRDVQAEVDRTLRAYHEALARAEGLGAASEPAPSKRGIRRGTRAEPAPLPAEPRAQRRSLRREQPSTAFGLRDPVPIPEAARKGTRFQPTTANRQTAPIDRAVAGKAGGTPSGRRQPTTKPPAGGTRQGMPKAARFQASDPTAVEAPGDRPGRRTRRPPVDVFDVGDKLVLEFEMPGVRKDQVQIVGKRRGITVSATSTPRTGSDPVLVSERGEIEYRREVPLDLEIEADEAEARFQNGILILEVPKKNPKKGAKRIEIED